MRRTFNTAGTCVFGNKVDKFYYPNYALYVYKLRYSVPIATVSCYDATPRYLKYVECRERFF